MSERIVNIIGAGLAGCEAALFLAKRGIKVRLIEAKPKWKSPAHSQDSFAEVVCSNSFKSNTKDTASGALKKELEILGCSLLEIAKSNSVNAGSALAVDRDKFSQAVTLAVKNNPHIQIVNEIAKDFNNGEYTIIATGPLTHDYLGAELQKQTGGFLHFYDAAAPIVSLEGIDLEHAFYGSRYNKGGNDDYLNCPLTKQEYDDFYNALTTADCVKLKDFEDINVFEGCMPVEVLAKRGYDALRYGPFKPVGFTDPKTSKRPYALLQLRKENTQGEMFNLVGCQTNLLFGEQKRVFSLIPALKNAEFMRYGVMHRNSFVNAPKVLDGFLQMNDKPGVFIAGQLCAVEGYVESIATGLIAALNVYRLLNNQMLIKPPKTTIIGALMNYLEQDNTNFQPMNANFGILPALDNIIKNKAERKSAYYNRCEKDMIGFKNHLIPFD